jgi:hypothetical protein
MYVHRNNLVAECDAAAATNGGTAANVVNTFVVVIIHCVRVAQFHSKDFREELFIDFVSARLSADISELESCRNWKHGHLTSLNDFVAEEVLDLVMHRLGAEAVLCKSNTSGIILINRSRNELRAAEVREQLAVY